jgi:hypothetical protein
MLVMNFARMLRDIYRTASSSTCPVIEAGA